MISFSDHQQRLFHRLQNMGMWKSTTLGYILSLKSCLKDNPNLNYLQINQRMQCLGWDDFEMDCHTLQLAISCFEDETRANPRALRSNPNIS